MWSCDAVSAFKLCRTMVLQLITAVVPVQCNHIQWVETSRFPCCAKLFQIHPAFKLKRDRWKDYSVQKKAIVCLLFAQLFHIHPTFQVNTDRWKDYSVGGGGQHVRSRCRGQVLLSANRPHELISICAGGSFREFCDAVHGESPAQPPPTWESPR